MLNKELILKKISKIDDKLFISKILDKALKSMNIVSVVHSDFLDPYQKALVEKAFSGCEDIDCTFDGGYAGAERTIIFFHPAFISFNDDIDRDSFFKVLRITLNSRDSLSHRDYLGSLMGLGIKREKIGDILVYEEACDVVVLAEIADYIRYNLTKIGSTKVGVEVKSTGELQVPEPKVREINTTVASLRLDCISSAGFGMSRNKAAEFIKAEKLNLNWEMTNSPTKQVKEGDTITIRGKGRVVIEKIGGTTKKGRISITLKKFI